LQCHSLLSRFAVVASFFGDASNGHRARVARGKQKLKTPRATDFRQVRSCRSYSCGRAAFRQPFSWRAGAARFSFHLSVCEKAIKDRINNRGELQNFMIRAGSTFCSSGCFYLAAGAFGRKKPSPG
jgi:hypothetical protein